MVIRQPNLGVHHDICPRSCYRPGGEEPDYSRWGTVASMRWTEHMAISHDPYRPLFT